MSLPLVILGLLHEGDLHPYEVIARLKRRSVDLYIKINFGTLYYHVARLAERGLIEAVGTEREEQRPERTIYRITPAGRAWFQEELLRHLTELQPVFYPIDAALPFVRFAEPAAVTTALANRMTALGQLLNRVEAIRGVFPSSANMGVAAVLDHGVTMIEAELSWLGRLHRLAQSSELFSAPPEPLDEQAILNDMHQALGDYEQSARALLGGHKSGRKPRSRRSSRPGRRGRSDSQ